ncbi:MAG: hypothetical protein A2Y40_00300 [Candidatus Margulisbacteria bacterium GWF2_35_9]|nr:MAG: hypothetical protein A2Y40_00300 [Candidatus Margulisbacteria bacterium GWF2_35_9]
MIKKIYIALILTFTIIILIGCNQKTIYTQREQTLIVPESQLAQMGQEAYLQVLSENMVISAGQSFQMVKRINDKLIPAVDAALTQYQRDDLLQLMAWQFSIVSQNSEVNAFCLPGGKVVVYTGILPLTSNDSELAVVLSHEIAHALLQHGNERMSEQLILQFGSQVLDEVLKKHPEDTRKIFDQVYGIGTTIGLALPHSREQESEADKVGLILMIKAGYDPDAALSFWKKMDDLGGQKPPEFLSTHPSDGHRIEAIKAFIPQAKELSLN